MTDFSKMIVAERSIEGGMREIRIVAPEGPIEMPDITRHGTEARKRLIRYIMANAAAFAPQLADELEQITALIHQDIDDEEEATS